MTLLSFIISNWGWLSAVLGAVAAYFVGTRRRSVIESKQAEDRYKAIEQQRNEAKLKASQTGAELRHRMQIEERSNVVNNDVSKMSDEGVLKEYKKKWARRN